MPGNSCSKPALLPVLLCPELPWLFIHAWVSGLADGNDALTVWGTKMNSQIFPRAVPHTTLLLYQHFPTNSECGKAEMGSESFPCVSHIFHFKERRKTVTQRSRSIRINLHNFVTLNKKNPPCFSCHSRVGAVLERPQKFEWFSVKVQLGAWCNKDQGCHQVEMLKTEKNPISVIPQWEWVWICQFEIRLGEK